MRARYEQREEAGRRVERYTDGDAIATGAAVDVRGRRGWRCDMPRCRHTNLPHRH